MVSCPPSQPLVAASTATVVVDDPVPSASIAPPPPHRRRLGASRRVASRIGRKLLVPLLYAVIAIGLLAPSASNEVVPSAADIVPHIGTIIQARMALEEGQFPIRVAPWQHNGWRYPVWQFYSPLPYTVTALIYGWIVPSNPYVAYKIMIWLALVVGGTFTYLLATWLTGSRPAAILAGAMYMAAPYFLMNIHARGAFPELVAQGILPATLYTSLRCYVVPKWRWIAFAAVGWCALALTHTIVFVYSTLFVGLWFLLLGGRPRKTIGRLLRLGAAYGLAWLLGLYFLVTVVSADYVRIRDSLPDPYTLSWYTPIATLLSPVSVAPEPQPYRIIGRFVHPSVGWPFLIAWGAMFHALVTQPARLRRRAALRFVAPLLLLFAVALFMTWSPFDFWSVLPRALYVTQYTYRLLTHVMWPGALLGAFALAMLFRGQLDGRHVVVGLLTIGLASGSFLPTLAYGYSRIDLLTQAPDMGYGQFDYLIKERLALDADPVGGVELPLVYADGWLILNTGLDVSPLRPYTAQPFSVRIDGAVPPVVALEPIRLTALLDGQRIASAQVGPGPFTWDIPLAEPIAARSRGQADRPLKLEIRSDRLYRPREVDPAASFDWRTLSVTANSVTIVGLPPSRSALTVGQTQPGCGRNGSELVCDVTVPPETGYVQLPALFYPGMLDVSVDGQPAPFRPLAHRTFILTGLELPPGPHEIRVRFRGVTWANWVSAAAWVGLVASLALSFIHFPALARTRRSVTTGSPLGSAVRSARRRVQWPAPE